MEHHIMFFLFSIFGRLYSKERNGLKAHERNAKRVLSLIIQLEGLWVKLGQYLSTRADVLPEAYTCLLKQLQDSLPARPLQEVLSIPHNWAKSD